MIDEIKKARILVVAGGPDIGTDILESLAALGCSAEVALSGDEAAAKAAGLRPDIVLVDISHSGGMDGIRTAEEILSRIDVPIVYIAESADPATVARARKTAPTDISSARSPARPLSRP
jgi:CheY-like chemotaxis protein